MLFLWKFDSGYVFLILPFSYEGKLGIDNKLNSFFKITGILNIVFTPQKKHLRKLE